MGRRTPPKFSPGDWVSWKDISALIIQRRKREGYVLRWNSGWEYHIRWGGDRKFESWVREEDLNTTQQELFAKKILAKRDLYEIEDPSIGYLGPNVHYTASEEEEKNKEKPKVE